MVDHLQCHAPMNRAHHHQVLCLPCLVPFLTLKLPQKMKPEDHWTTVRSTPNIALYCNCWLIYLHCQTVNNVKVRALFTEHRTVPTAQEALAKLTNKYKQLRFRNSPNHLLTTIYYNPKLEVEIAFFLVLYLHSWHWILTCASPWTKCSI